MLPHGNQVEHAIIELCALRITSVFSSQPSDCGQRPAMKWAQCGGNETCELGVCTCGAPFEACDASRVNRTSDPAHCGSCGAACAETQGCADGGCIDVSRAPFVTWEEAGDVGTIAAICIRIAAAGAVNGNCWFAEGRTLTIDGTLADRAGFEAEVFDDGFVYFEVGAGGNTWDGFGMW